MANFKNNYDLEERVARFGEEIILFCRRVKKDPIVLPLLVQLIKSATSIGANYMEANGASSRKDFANKIYLAKKEAQETNYWLRMLSVYYPNELEKLQKYRQESHEFTLIFHKIVRTIKDKDSKEPDAIKILK